MNVKRDDLYPIIQLLLKVANKGHGAPVTLNVNGTIVVGELMSEADYLKNLSEVMAKSYRKIMPGESGEKVAETIINNWGSVPEDKELDPSYLFLQNAKILQCGVLIEPKDGANWCIRTDAVVSFAWGALSATKT